MIKLFTYAELEEKGDIGSCVACPYADSQGDCTSSENCRGGYFREVPDEPVLRFITDDEAEEMFGEDYMCCCKHCYFDSHDGCCENGNDCESMGIFILETPPVKPQVNPGLLKEPVPPAEGVNEENQQANMVTPPDRYNWRGTEVLPFTFENNLNALQYAVLKYLYRYPQKQGKIALDKAVIYLKKGIEHGARPNQINAEVIEKYLTDNNWSWREGTCVMTLLLGSYVMCLDRIEKLIKEVYGTEED